MKDYNSLERDSEMEGLAYGAGAMSETTQLSESKQKRKTVFIKLHPKPNAPRNSAVAMPHLRNRG